MVKEADKYGWKKNDLRILTNKDKAEPEPEKEDR